MNIFSLGKITVPTPGTPVALPNITCTQLMFAVPASNAGKVYIGVPGMVKATGAGVVAELPKAPVTGTPAMLNPISMSGQGNQIVAAQFVIDADTANDGCYVSGFVE